MTARSNGTETGTLKTRIDILIRDQAVAWHGQHLGGRCQATLARKASSAAPTASGVPTCIQTPSSRKPNSRSCSLARSNIFVREKSPFGASANSDGDMIEEP